MGSQLGRLKLFATLCATNETCGDEGMDGACELDQVVSQITPSLSR